MTNPYEAILTKLLETEAREWLRRYADKSNEIGRGPARQWWEENLEKMEKIRGKEATLMLRHAMNKEINQVVRAPDVEPRFSQEGATALAVTPKEFAAYVERELKKWAEAVRVSGAKAD